MLTKLLYRAQGGDKEALRELMERFQPLILATARRLKSADTNWQDLVQEGRLSLLEAIYDFRARGGAPFPWYARRRVYYGLYNYRRREMNTRQREGLILSGPAGEEEGESLLDLLPAQGEGPEGQVLRRASYLSLRLALARLPDKQRRVLQGLYFAGQGVTELAREMGITPPSVKGLEARGLKNLAKAGILPPPGK